MAAFTYSNSTVIHWSDTNKETLPIYLGSNDYIPRFVYKEFPISILLIGAIPNFILFYYLIASKKYKSPLFTFIASLTISDTLSCIGIASWAGLIFPYVVLSNASLTCQITLLIGNIATSASGFHLVFFSLLRYYQLCFPLHARAKVTASAILKICLAIWISGVVVYIVIVMYYQSSSVIYEGFEVEVCAFVGNTSARDWFFMIVNTVMPCSIILIMHVLKYIHILCHAKTVDVQQKRQNTDARAVAIVIILFFITWGPVNIYTITHTWAPGEGPYQDKLFLTLAYVLAYNSILNPIVYMLVVKSIRNDILTFLCHRKTASPDKPCLNRGLCPSNLYLNSTHDE